MHLGIADLVTLNTISHFLYLLEYKSEGRCLESWENWRQDRLHPRIAVF